jgi:hypothetical protein
MLPEGTARVPVRDHEDMASPNLDWMIGDSVRAVRLVEPASWWFEFARGGSIRVEALWRVVVDGKIQSTSQDHGHQFGLSTPVDSVSRAVQALANVAVRKASANDETGDLVLEFENSSRLEVLTTSCGYESWSLFSPNGDEAIGLGGGQICVHPKRR